MKQYTLRQPRDPQEPPYSIGYIRNLTQQSLGARQYWGYTLKRRLSMVPNQNKYGFKIGMHTFIICYDTMLQSYTEFRYKNIICCSILPCYSVCPIATQLCFPAFVLWLGLGSVRTRTLAQCLLLSCSSWHSCSSIVSFTQLQNSAQLYSFLCLSCVPCNLTAPFSLRTVLESAPNLTATPTCVRPVVGPGVSAYTCSLHCVSCIAVTLSPCIFCVAALPVLIS